MGVTISDLPTVWSPWLLALIGVIVLTVAVAISCIFIDYSSVPIFLTFAIAILLLIAGPFFHSWQKGNVESTRMDNVGIVAEHYNVKFTRTHDMEMGLPPAAPGQADSYLTQFVPADSMGDTPIRAVIRVTENNAVLLVEENEETDDSTKSAFGNLVEYSGSSKE